MTVRIKRDNDDIEAGGSKGTRSFSNGDSNEAGSTAGANKMAFELTNAVESFHALSGGINQIWGFLGVLAAGVVTIVWTTGSKLDSCGKGVLAALFMLLALGNLVVVAKSQRQSRAMLEAIKKQLNDPNDTTPANFKTAIKKLTAASVPAAVLAHFAIDVATVAAILIRPAT